MLSTIQGRWEEILQALKEEHEISDVSFRTWLLPLQVVDVKENEHKVIILVSEEQLGVSYIEKKYKFLLQLFIEEVTGFSCEIEFVLPKDMKEDSPSEKETSIPTPRTNSLSSIIKASNLIEKHTFDSFVVGSNNKMAHAASLAVAESPGEIYNPLFIYGGVGLGKTHLMHAIGNFILKNNPKKKVMYVASEIFMNELIDAIRLKNNISTTEFREKYRNIDVLLIDDIQFIIGKESTQEEFFHTFNTLHDAKKQIIISSDRPPKEFETLEDRLVSRFEWGLTVDIQSPDYETRMAILRKKEDIEGYNIDNEVIKYIATNIKSNIRELEGALTRVVAASKLDKREITIELAEESLKDMITPNQKREITPNLVIDIVSDHFHVTPADIMSSKRNKEIVLPRQITMYLCRHMTSTTLDGIGKFLGNKDHTTILHGIEKISKELERNETLQNTMEVLKKKINPY
ncbi:MAG: chromosomal replication initiator protein DnaA [Lachnospiraceae bacterium]|nr:chromosomal replication initiator protein DnaA [Lachnospiraceae bacterium]